MREYKRTKDGVGDLDLVEVLSTFNESYAFSLHALNHSHPEVYYKDYFKYNTLVFTDVEVIKAFVYVLLSAERHRVAHTALLLEDLEYSDRQGTIRYFAKALGIPFAASATGHEGDGEEQNADAPAQESGAKPRTKPMIFKNEAETLRWAEVVNDTLAGTIEDRFVSRRCNPQLLSIVYFDYWWGHCKAYKGGKLPSVPKLLYFFTAHCGFTADLNAQGEYKNAGNGINEHIMREGGKPKINDKTKKTYPSLWSKIKEAVKKNTIAKHDAYHAIIQGIPKGVPFFCLKRQKGIPFALALFLGNAVICSRIDAVHLPCRPKKTVYEVKALLVYCITLFK